MTRRRGGLRRPGEWIGREVALLLALGVSVAGAEAARFPALFGTREVRSANLAPFPKWTGMLARDLADRDLDEGSCASATFNRCHLRDWRAFLDRIRDRNPMAQLDAVNRYMNQAPYIIDPRNYGVPDYWATPHQFLARDGDCEDYAIAKYMSLKALGWDPGAMRVVVLRDLNLQIAHAVLVVYRDDVAWMLDNQIETVVDAARIQHYRPYYSINEDGWWLHRP